ncbi:MAG: zf-HC2 domain-containing protein [Pseudomonadota bacterium]
MIGCADVQKYIDIYLDRELGKAEARDIKDHLETCLPCRRLATSLTRLKGAVRSGCHHPPLPPGLATRISAALDRADAAGLGPLPRTRRQLVPVFAVAAVAAVAAAVVGYVVTHRTEDHSYIVEEAIRAHERNLPLEVSGSEDAARSFFSSRVPVPVQPPHFQDSEVLFVGGRLSHLRGRDAAQLSYRVKRSPVTVHVFDASGIAMPGNRRLVENREFFLGNSRGYSVVMFHDRGVGYAFTSTLDEESLLQLVRTLASK